jgi:hypothetical protein
METNRKSSPGEGSGTSRKMIEGLAPALTASAYRFLASHMYDQIEKFDSNPYGRAMAAALADLIPDKEYRTRLGVVLGNMNPGEKERALEMLLEMHEVYYMNESEYWQGAAKFKESKEFERNRLPELIGEIHFAASAPEMGYFPIIVTTLIEKAKFANSQGLDYVSRDMLYFAADHAIRELFREPIESDKITDIAKAPLTAEGKDWMNRANSASNIELAAITRDLLGIMDERTGKDKFLSRKLMLLAIENTAKILENIKDRKVSITGKEADYNQRVVDEEMALLLKEGGITAFEDMPLLARLSAYMKSQGELSSDDVERLKEIDDQYVRTEILSGGSFGGA